jgi:hypothetical protein
MPQRSTIKGTSLFLAAKGYNPDTSRYIPKENKFCINESQTCSCIVKGLTKK